MVRDTKLGVSYNVGVAITTDGPTHNLLLAVAPGAARRRPDAQGGFGALRAGCTAGGDDAEDDGTIVHLEGFDLCDCRYTDFCEDPRKK